MDERRAWPRHALKPPVIGRLLAPDFPSGVMTVIHDVSARGVGLYLCRRPPTGLRARLELIDGPVPLRRAMIVRIAHARDDPGGGFHIGGELACPLSADDLRVLLPEPGAG